MDLKKIFCFFTFEKSWWLLLESMSDTTFMPLYLGEVVPLGNSGIFHLLFLYNTARNDVLVPKKIVKET